MQIGESIGLLVMTTDKENCWFCKEEPKDPNLRTDLDETPSSVGKTENDLGNDSSKLGSALGHKPSWTIKVAETGESASVVPAAHHLIPGGGSLNKVPALTAFLKKGAKIRADVGYDVNCRENGIWLPGSYGVNVNTGGQKWSNYGPQNDYAVAAMKRAGAQFHDAHPTYNERLKTTLRAIANRMVVNHPVTCPGCGEKVSDKARPPYGIVGRLAAVSRRHRAFLDGPVRNWPLASGYYTSKRSALMNMKL